MDQKYRNRFLFIVSILLCRKMEHLCLCTHQQAKKDDQAWSVKSFGGEAKRWPADERAHCRPKRIRVSFKLKPSKTIPADGFWYKYNKRCTITSLLRSRNDESSLGGLLQRMAWEVCEPWFIKAMTSLWYGLNRTGRWQTLTFQCVFLLLRHLDQ